MKVPPWCKPAFWGIVVGAVGIMIIGFVWWGWVLGSTAERVVRHAPCPVLVVREQEHEFVMTI